MESLFGKTSTEICDTLVSYPPRFFALMIYQHKWPQFRCLSLCFKVEGINMLVDVFCAKKDPGNLYLPIIVVAYAQVFLQQDCSASNGCSMNNQDVKLKKDKEV